MPDLDQQLFDYFEGNLSPEELENLKQKFIDDPEFQTTMVDLTVTERLLKTLSEPGNHAQEIVDTIRMERQATPMAPYIRNNLERERTTFRWKKTRDAFLIAASVMVLPPPDFSRAIRFLGSQRCCIVLGKAKPIPAIAFFI